MPAKLYRVNLIRLEREQLRKLISKGRVAVRKQTHARILLLCDEASQQGGNKKDGEIIAALNISRQSVAGSPAVCGGRVGSGTELKAAQCRQVGLKYSAKYATISM